MRFENVIIKLAEGKFGKVNISISNGNIADVEIISADPSEFSDANFYVTSGFVNSHLHPNLLLDRRKLDELGIDELLDQMHNNYKKSDEDRLHQALFVLMEAVKSGATSIYSVANKPKPVIKAYKMLGLKGAISCFFNDQWEGFGSPPSLSMLKDIEHQFEELYKQKTEDVDIHIGASSVQGTSNDLLKLLDHLAEKFDTKVNIHVSEGCSHVKSCQKNRYTTPIRLLDKLKVLNHRWNLIHAVHVDDEEIGMIALARATVTHSPVSNAKTGVGIAPILKMMKAGIKIGLGTDSCSNNNTNNILNEAYFASLLHCATHGSPSAVSKDTLYRWMTVNGHEILGRSQKGTIEIGEPADLVFWALDSNAFVPRAFGKYDAALLWNAPDLKPHSVFINGKPVVEGYQFTAIPEKEICDKANQCAEKFQAYLKQAKVALV